MAILTRVRATLSFVGVFARSLTVHYLGAESTIGGGSGYVKNITFKDFHGRTLPKFMWSFLSANRCHDHVVENVDNPIYINQVRSELVSRFVLFSPTSWQL